MKLFLVKQELQKAFIYVTNRGSFFFVTNYCDKKDFQSKAELINDLYKRFGIRIGLFVFNILRKEIIFCGDELYVNKLKKQLSGEIVKSKEIIQVCENLFFWYSYEDWPPYGVDYYYKILVSK